ncbi:MAG: 2-C-methyl-D-erythritol 2,4-cyclodiphosphate synthase [Breznakia sp.]
MFRVGQSSDIHAFCEGDHLTIGGVQIPFDKGIKAHSDGDALCHVIAEAMLGALALKDLGTHFSDTDEKNEGMSSLTILAQVYEKIKAQGYIVQNIDSLILIEKPKMASYIAQMQTNIANTLLCDAQAISVKATRGEGLGFIGKSEGFMAQCVVLLKREPGKD